MANNLTGAASLAYQGTNAASPSNITVHYNRPTANFYQGFSIGDFWVYRPVQTTNNNELWVLMGVAGNVANWVLLSTSTGAVLQLQGNTGGPVGPTAGVINVVGTGSITVTGNPGTSTLTIGVSGGGTIVETLTANSGGAVSPLAGNISVVGDGTTINIVGNPGTHTLTASLVGGGVAAQSFITNAATGTATPTSGGVLTFTNGNNITFTAGGHSVAAAVTGTTNHTLQVGNATGSLTSLAAATNGQIPIGSTGANPTIATITAGTGISVTNGAGSITIANTSVSPATTNSFFAYVSAETLTNPFTGGANVMPYDATLFNNGGNYNTGTYTYTAPVTGYYSFTSSCCLNHMYPPSTVTEYATVFTATGASYSASQFSPFAAGALQNFMMTTNTALNGISTIFCHMTAGDTMFIYIFINNTNGSGAVTVDVTGTEAGPRYRSYFSGYQVA